MNRLLCILGLGAAAAMAAPNFGGKWKMDGAKSDFGPLPAPTSLERTIKHSDPDMELETKQVGARGEVVTSMKYKTDGSESVNTIRGTEVKSVVKWEGEKLVVKYKRETPQGEVAIEERWELSSDGKVTTILINISGGFGELQTKTVLNKE
jgi:hypothetical protein